MNEINRENEGIIFIELFSNLKNRAIQCLTPKHVENINFLKFLITVYIQYWRPFAGRFL